MGFAFAMPVLYQNFSRFILKQAIGRRSKVIMVGLSLLGVANRTEAVSLALRKHLLKS